MISILSILFPLAAIGVAVFVLLRLVSFVVEIQRSKRSDTGPDRDNS